MLILSPYLNFTLSPSLPIPQFPRPPSQAKLASSNRWFIKPLQYDQSIDRMWGSGKMRWKRRLLSILWIFFLPSMTRKCTENNWIYIWQYSQIRVQFRGRWRTSAGRGKSKSPSRDSNTRVLEISNRQYMIFFYIYPLKSPFLSHPNECLGCLRFALHINLKTILGFMPYWFQRADQLPSGLAGQNF